MKRILIFFIVLLVLSFTALTLKTFAQDEEYCITPNAQFTRVEQDSIIKTNVELLKNLLPQDSRKFQKLWHRSKGINQGNEYRISLKFNNKKDTVNFFHFYLVQDSVYTAFRYWPEKNETILLIFTFKKPCAHCAGFTKWKYYDFQESFIEANYVIFPKKEREPEYVWVRIPKISTIPISVMKNFMEICQKIQRINFIKSE